MRPKDVLLPLTIAGAFALGGVVGVNLPHGENGSSAAPSTTPAICRGGTFDPNQAEYYETELSALGDAQVIKDKDGKPVEIILNSPYISRVDTTEEELVAYVVVGSSNSNLIRPYVPFGVKVNQQTWVYGVNFVDGSDQTSLGNGIIPFQEHVAGLGGAGAGAGQYLDKISIKLTDDALIYPDNQTGLATSQNNVANGCSDTPVYDADSVTMYK